MSTTTTSSTTATTKAAPRKYETLSVQVSRDNNKDRIDAFIQKNLLTELTRAQIAKLIQAGGIKANDSTVTKPLYKIKTGEIISVDRQKFKDLFVSSASSSSSATVLTANNKSSTGKQQAEEASHSSSTKAKDQNNDESLLSKQQEQEQQDGDSQSSSSSVVPAQDLALEVIYEDNDIIVVNKPCGMIVHPSGNRNQTGTLVNALLFKYGISQLSTCGIEPEHYRPGIVHRLDKDTTGVMVVAKNDEAHRALQEQFLNKSDENSKLNRSYVALVHNHVKLHHQMLDLYIGRHKAMPQKRIIVPQSSAVTLSNTDDDYHGDNNNNNRGGKGPKRAITHCKVRELLTVGKEKFTLVELKLATGRTHQIRVSMAHIEHPVVGDILYNPALKKKKSGQKRGKDTSILTQFDQDFAGEFQMLHARRLGFLHPRTKEYVEFTAEPPALFTKVVDTIKTAASKAT